LRQGPAARARLGQAARRRVQECFGLEAITRRYEALYDELLLGAALPGVPIYAQAPGAEAVQS
jgi:hypothetical protein